MKKQNLPQGVPFYDKKYQYLGSSTPLEDLKSSLEHSYFSGQFYRICGSFYFGVIRKSISIVKTQASISCPNPYFSYLIFQNRPNGVVDQSILSRKTGERFSIITANAMTTQPKISVAILDHPCNGTTG